MLDRSQNRHLFPIIIRAMIPLRNLQTQCFIGPEVTNFSLLNARSLKYNVTTISSEATSAHQSLALRTSCLSESATRLSYPSIMWISNPYQYYPLFVCHTFEEASSATYKDDCPYDPSYWLQCLVSPKATSLLEFPNCFELGAVVGPPTTRSCQKERGKNKEFYIYPGLRKTEQPSQWMPSAHITLTPKATDWIGSSYTGS